MTRTEYLPIGLNLRVIQNNNYQEFPSTSCEAIEQNALVLMK